MEHDKGKWMEAMRQMNEGQDVPFDDTLDATLDDWAGFGWLNSIEQAAYDRLKAGQPLTPEDRNALAPWLGEEGTTHAYPIGGAAYGVNGHVVWVNSERPARQGWSVLVVREKDNRRVFKAFYPGDDHNALERFAAEHPDFAPPRPQNRHLRPNPHTLGVQPLPEGYRPTKAMRFTLPEALADRLEAMPKAERDELMRKALGGAV